MLNQILFAMAMLAVSLVPAHAEHEFSVKTTRVGSLPTLFAGHWCLINVETMRNESWEEYKKDNECPRHDYMAFCKRSPSSMCGGGGYDYELTEQGCKIISVKRVITHRVERPTVTTYHTVARCYGEGDGKPWIEKREFGLPEKGLSAVSKGQPGLYFFSQILK
jgi:hypothetical protein